MRVRYDTRDEDGKTRREKYQNFIDSGSNVVEAPPDIIPPIGGQHLWEWYFDLSSRLRRVRDGVCEPIAPSEYMAWAVLADEIVYPHEYAILGAMDVAFCDEMGKELEAFRQRQEERSKRK